MNVKRIANSLTRRSLRLLRSPTPLVPLSGVAGNRQLVMTPFQGGRRTGLLSTKGTLDGSPVKIYEAFSEKHAAFIAHLSGTDLAGLVPPCLAREGRFLVTQWMPGRALTQDEVLANPQLMARIARIQVSLHATQSNQSPGFDYAGFLLDRYERFLGPLAMSHEYATLSATIREHPVATSTAVSHPDLTPVNLVLDTEHLYLIDNELLGQNHYVLIDLFNTIRSLGGTKQTARKYLRAYVDAGGDLSGLSDTAAFYHALWQIRLIGRILSSGDSSELSSILAWPIEQNVVLQAAREVV